MKNIFLCCPIDKTRNQFNNLINKINKFNVNIISMYDLTNNCNKDDLRDCVINVIDNSDIIIANVDKTDFVLLELLRYASIKNKLIIKVTNSLQNQNICYSDIKITTPSQLEMILLNNGLEYLDNIDNYEFNPKDYIDIIINIILDWSSTYVKNEQDLINNLRYTLTEDLITISLFKDNQVIRRLNIDLNLLNEQEQKKAIERCNILTNFNHVFLMTNSIFKIK